MNPRYSILVSHTYETYGNRSCQRRARDSGREIKRDYFYDLLINRLLLFRPFFLRCKKEIKNHENKIQCKEIKLIKLHEMRGIFVAKVCH